MNDGSVGYIELLLLLLAVQVMSFVPVLIALEAIHEGRFIDESPVELGDEGVGCAVLSLALVFLSLTVWWTYRFRPVARDALMGAGLGWLAPVLWIALSASGWIVVAYSLLPCATTVMLMHQTFEFQVAQEKVQLQILGDGEVRKGTRVIRESYYLNYRWIQVLAGLNLLHILFWPLIYPMDTEGWDRRWPLICQNLIIAQTVVFGIAYLYVLADRRETAATACAGLAALVPVGMAAAVSAPAWVVSCILPGLLCALVVRMYVLGKRGGKPPGVEGPQEGR